MEVVVSSSGAVVQGEVQKVALESEEPSFQEEELVQVVQEQQMVTAYLVEAEVGAIVKFQGVIHQAVNFGPGQAWVLQAAALEEGEGEPVEEDLWALWNF